MRILVVSGLYDPHLKGGAEVMAAALCRGLVARGHRVVVASTHEGVGLITEDRDGVIIRRYGIKNSYWHFKHDKAPSVNRLLWHWRDSYNIEAGLDIKDAVNSFNPDVAVCHNLPGFSVSAWEVLNGLGVPVVQVLHDYYTLCPRNVLFRNGRNCETPCISCNVFRLRHRAAVKNLTGLIAVSKAMLESHERQGMFQNVPIKKIVYNARPVRSIEKKNPSGREIVFGFIGALTPEKGIRLLLRAFKDYCVECPDTRLLVAGKGESSYVSDLRKFAEALPVDFIGHVDSADFYKKVNVCVVPSVWNDPLPGVVFEALANGVPVIGSKRGGIPEMIKDGVNGLLFDVEDTSTLVLKMKRLKSESGLLARLVENSRQSVSIFTDEERMLKEHEAVYIQSAIYERKAQRERKAN